MAILRVKDENGNIIEIPAIKGDKGDPASATDVQINGTSITQDGVANIPVATDKTKGVVQLEPQQGINAHYTGIIYINKASEKEIDAKASSYKPIVPATLDYAVKKALTDNKGSEWTIEEQSKAKELLGVEGSDIDVQINGASIVADGIANIPIAAQGTFGLVKTDAKWYSGLEFDKDNILKLISLSEGHIDNRYIHTSGVIHGKNLDYAVKAAMTDGKGAEWTNEEKVSARDRLGLEWTLIDTMEVTEEVAQVQIDFPQEYSEFMVIADIKGNGTSVIYPIGGYFNTDEPNHLKGYTLPFTDFYPSTNDEHYELVFEKMNIENDTFLKISGFESVNYAKKMKQNIQSTGWLQQYNVTNEHQCRCWYGVKFQRTITNATFKIYAR